MLAENAEENIVILTRIMNIQSIMQKNDHNNRFEETGHFLRKSVKIDKNRDHNNIGPWSMELSYAFWQNHWPSLELNCRNVITYIIKIIKLIYVRKLLKKNIRKNVNQILKNWPKCKKSTLP
jgi:hypothetical protein